VAMGACVPTFLRFAGEDRSNHNLQPGVLELTLPDPGQPPPAPDAAGLHCRAGQQESQKLPMVSVFGDHRI
jgi:hypothetical protein